SRAIDAAIAALSMPTPDARAVVDGFDDPRCACGWPLGDGESDYCDGTTRHEIVRPGKWQEVEPCPAKVRAGARAVVEGLVKALDNSLMPPWPTGLGPGPEAWKCQFCPEYGATAEAIKHGEDCDHARNLAALAAGRAFLDGAGGEGGRRG
ncbi:MAG: hypothetical protein Q8S13_12340, partial [Dehalococcoidia bacterium]|nr:hypothetical protein [Dehalococcoidia bacterium]